MPQWFKDVFYRTERVLAVCTGTILLCMTGLLDGPHATTNKLGFTLTVHQVPNANWLKEARSVQDGKFFTSSGVSAGTDMAMAALSDLYSTEKEEETAVGSEYTSHRNVGDDPFAKLAGLV